MTIYVGSIISSADLGVTGTTIASRLHTLPASVTDAKTLKALNAAIDDAWPMLGELKYAADAVTLAASTPEYELSSLSIDQRFGVSQIFLTDESDLPDVLIRSCRQVFNPTTGYWTLVLPSSVYDTYAGKTLSLTYYAPVANVTALSDYINLPSAYLTEYVIFWYLKDARWSNEKNVSLGDVSWQEARMIDTKKRCKVKVPFTIRVGKDKMA